MLELLARRIRAIERHDPAPDTIYGSRERRPAGRVPVAAGPPFHCPVCGGRYRRFLPFGLAGRRNAMCPGCGSLERHRFLWLYLRDSVGVLRRRARVLHVAPERCIATALSASRALRYTSLDLFDPAARHRADVTALPFPDATFDIIVCSHVLEHVEDDRRAMRELARVLRPAARAVIMVPIDMRRGETYEDPSITTAAGRNAAFGHPYHVRICGADYPGRLAEAGFSVHPAYSTALSGHHRRHWRISKTVLFDCRRKDTPGAK